MYFSDVVAFIYTFSPKAGSRGIQMYDLSEPLLFVGVSQQKSASISSNFRARGQKSMGASHFHLGEAYFGINFQINIKLQKLIMNLK